MKQTPGIYELHGKRGTTYKVKWRDLHGKQHSKTFKNATDARKFDRQLRSDKDKGLAGPSGLNTTFSELVELWIETVAHHADSAAKRRDGILRNHLLPAFGPMKLPRITALEIDKASQRWAAQGLSAYSIRNHLQILGQAMRYAVKVDMVARNPVENATRVRLPHPEARSLTSDEVSALRQAIDPHYDLFICTAVVTGFRFSELAGLTAADLDGETLHVRSGKTPNAKRSVPIFKELADQLRASLPSLRPDDFLLFQTKAGKKIHNSNFRERYFIPAIQKAGLNGVTFHDLRSTRATMIVHAGTDPRTVMRLMGHARIETTMTHYVNASPAAEIKAAEVGREFILGSQVA